MTIKMGILQCDDVRLDLQADHGNYPAMFTQLLRDAGDAVDLVFYRALDGELPQHADECDVYMTTGSRHSVNDDLPWIPRCWRLCASCMPAKRSWWGSALVIS
ncbi:hypothetical protein [Photobacterium sp. Hal280]|uniref:hypothetical protein n=1 Tax=Photobacterium sp. Hal280 TaxID=3035163 RepID=UPI00301CAEE2